MTRLSLLALIFCLALPTQAQMYPVSLEERIAASSLVVEGKVMAQESLWDDGKNNIYTLHTLAVAKVFKGEVISEQVMVLTRGGLVGMEKEDVCPSLHLQPNDYGLLTLTPSGVNIQGHSLTYFAQAGPQGFIQFNTFDGKLKGVYDSYMSTESDLYSKCEAAIGDKYSVIQSLSYDKRDFSNSAKSITSISPTTQTAGTKSTITITGADFGSEQGIVAFQSADAAGVAYFGTLATEVHSWSDMEIVVEVPDRAGTGQVVVQTANQVQFISSATLQIDYAQQLVAYAFPDAPNTLYTYRTRLVNETSTQGYTWQLNTDFASNSAAAESFERAIDTWVDATCMNWSIGANTSVNTVASDNVNAVFFVESSVLMGAIGRCTSRYSICSLTNPDWLISEMDIEFDESVNWHFGEGQPSSSQYDFQSVATHELGHGHQLGHVIAPNTVMHRAIGNGQTIRTPTQNEIDAATDVMTRSIGSQICGQPSATASSNCCPAQEGTISSVTASEASICFGGSSTITVSGSLNDATAWKVYSGSCGGTSEGEANNTLTVNPSVTTTYFVRGEDDTGCLDESALTCSSVTISVEDVIAPEIACPGDKIVQGDEIGDFTLLDYTDEVSFSDNCDSSPDITQFPGLGTSISGISNSISLTVTDVSGNSALCAFNIQVLVLDSDEDGIPDLEDNCPDDANADQADLDEDDEGDFCDSDIDGDGVDNDADCDPLDAALFEGAICDDGDSDTMTDLIQDDCSCAGILIDTDSDGVTDSADNCPDDSNADQADLDEDDEGDACDDDIDGDGVNNEEDCEPLNPLISDCTCPTDLDGDGLVNISDFLEFNTFFGTVCDGCPADFNGDGLVNTEDFLILNTAFGTSCP